MAIVRRRADDQSGTGAGEHVADRGRQDALRDARDRRRRRSAAARRGSRARSAATAHASISSARRRRGPSGRPRLQARLMTRQPASRSAISVAGAPTSSSSGCGETQMTRRHLSPLARSSAAGARRSARRTPAATTRSDRSRARRSSRTARCLGTPALLLKRAKRSPPSAGQRRMWVRLRSLASLLGPSTTAPASTGPRAVERAGDVGDLVLGTVGEGGPVADDERDPQALAPRTLPSQRPAGSGRLASPVRLAYSLAITDRPKPCDAVSSTSHGKPKPNGSRRPMRDRHPRARAAGLRAAPPG